MTETKTNMNALDGVGLVQKIMLRNFAKKLISEVEKKSKLSVKFMDVNLDIKEKVMTSAAFGDDDTVIMEGQQKKLSQDDIKQVTSLFVGESIKTDDNTNINFLFSKTALVIEVQYLEGQPTIKGQLKF
jgi:hypothetical protein